MIAPLRNTHRRTFTVLALVVPAVLAIGVFARHPKASVVQPPTNAVELRSTAGHFAVFTLQDGRMSVRTITPVPDPLLYWTSAPSAPDILDPGTLIGPADPNAVYDLPSDAGYLVLYSGGHGRIVDSLRLDARP